MWEKNCSDVLPNVLFHSSSMPKSIRRVQDTIIEVFSHAWLTSVFPIIMINYFNKHLLCTWQELSTIIEQQQWTFVKCLLCARHSSKQVLLLPQINKIPIYETICLIWLRTKTVFTRFYYSRTFLPRKMNLWIHLLFQELVKIHFFHNSRLVT